MTDLPLVDDNVPSRIGATARLEGDELVIELVPRPALLRGSAVRTSVLSYVVDCSAGITLSMSRPDAWTFTTDMAVIAVAEPAPGLITARFRVQRRSARRATGRVTLVDGDGRLVGEGGIGFAFVDHREGEPPLPKVTIERLVAGWGLRPPLEVPLREAVGVEVVDAARGAVRVAMREALWNMSGTLQGAMTALIAEAAAEEALSVVAGEPVLVTDLNIRYLARTGAGPVVTRTDVLGTGTNAAAVVELIDESTDTLVALVHARAARLPR